VKKQADSARTISSTSFFSSCGFVVQFLMDYFFFGKTGQKGEKGAANEKAMQSDD
jgi:hypothetical protein